MREALKSMRPKGALGPDYISRLYDNSLCGTAWESLISWSTMEQIGSSEYQLIAIYINEGKLTGRIYKGQPRWKSSGVDWKAYT